MWAAYLILGAVALANAGCLVAAAAGAAGGLAGYAYYKGKVCRSYLANPADVHAATLKALAELQLPVAKDEPKADGGTIEAFSGTDKVAISMEQTNNSNPADGPLTEVGIRVGLVGDEGLSMRILDQISFHLVPPGVVPTPPPLGPPQPQLPPEPVPQQSAAPPLAK
jgi:hypothetical protein